MKQYNINDLNEKYGLELDKVIFEIKKAKARLVLLQFSDGLKIYATSVVDYLFNQLKDTGFLIWIDSCFGACDTPILSEDLIKKIDLIIQFGHNNMIPNY